MRLNLILGLTLILLLGCTKQIEDNDLDIEIEKEPEVEICDQNLPGYLIVDEKKHDACELEFVIDSLVEASVSWPLEFVRYGLTLDINDDSLDDFKIYPFGNSSPGSSSFGMTIESLNDSSYFATTEVFTFNFCKLYHPYSGVYMDCSEYCDEFSPEKLDPDSGLDTIPYILSTKYVEAFSPGDLIDDSLHWEQEETHFFKNYSRNAGQVPDIKCWPESKWQSWKNDSIYYVPIMQINTNGASSFGWIKMEYGGQYFMSNWEPIPHAFVHETFIQRE